jgi:hypothetical protein
MIRPLEVGPNEIRGFGKAVAMTIHEPDIDPSRESGHSRGIAIGGSRGHRQEGSGTANARRSGVTLLWVVTIDGHKVGDGRKRKEKVEKNHPYNIKLQERSYSPLNGC